MSPIQDSIDGILWKAANPRTVFSSVDSNGRREIHRTISTLWIHGIAFVLLGPPYKIYKQNIPLLEVLIGLYIKCLLALVFQTMVSNLATVEPNNLNVGPSLCPTMYLAEFLASTL